MTVYIVKTLCFLFPDAATALHPPAPAGTPKLQVFDRFDGGFSAAVNQLIDKTAPPPTGVVDRDCLVAVPATLLPITTEVGKTAFCLAVTDAAAAEMADRNYLLSVAYFRSEKLGNFGKPEDLRYGPFRYNAEEWFPAVAEAKKAGHPSLEPEDLFDPGRQVTVAAIRTGKAMKDFKAAHGRFPIPVELFFYERLDEEGLALLKLSPGQTCAAAFAAVPPARSSLSYRTEIKDRPSDEVIKEVTKGLIGGFVASRPDVERLEPHRRFFNDEDIAPWLTVARLMTSENVAIDPTTLAGQFMTFQPALGANDRRSAAFVAFCLIGSGIADAKAKVLAMDNTAGLPATWKGNWAPAATDPMRPGTVVVVDAEDGKESVGLLAETPTDDNYKVYFCSETDTVKVGIKTIAKAKVKATRWLDITGGALAVDPTALANAPAQIKGTVPMAQQAFTRLRGAGWTAAQACGILANIQAESGFDFKNTTGDGGQAHGICQWHPDRQAHFTAQFGKTIAAATLDEQVDFITFEMNHKEKDAGDLLRKVATPANAARIVCTEYERPQKPIEDSAKRIPLAEAYALVFR